MRRPKDPIYSIVIPAYNEADNIPELLNRIHAALSGLGKSYEIIIVDDGSKDATWHTIARAHGEDARIRAFRLSRNFGHQAALIAGISKARGEFTAIMDCDGQDPPELLEELFSKVEEGYDVAYAVRKSRKETPWKQFSYKLFYKILSKMTSFNIPQDSGDFAAMNRRVVQTIQSLQERELFLRGVRAWAGGKQVAVSYDRPSRMGGTSKYSYFKLLGLAISGMVSFSRTPLRAITIFGFICSALSLGLALIMGMYKIFIGIEIPGWTMLFVCLCFIGGVQFTVLGVIGEYIGTIFEEVKQRPRFLILDNLDQHDK